MYCITLLHYVMLYYIILLFHDIYLYFIIFLSSRSMDREVMRSAVCFFILLLDQQCITVKSQYASGWICCLLFVPANFSSIISCSGGAFTPPPRHICRGYCMSQASHFHYLHAQPLPFTCRFHLIPHPLSRNSHPSPSYLLSPSSLISSSSSSYHCHYHH